MIKKDLVLLAVFGLFLVGWLLFAGRDGYTGNNAIIVARSISVVSTMEGEVEALSVKVGSTVAEGDLLARIQNGRIDRSRLTELESQLEYLHSEIKTARAEQDTLTKLLESFEKQAANYTTWFTQNLQLRRQETLLDLNGARERDSLKSAELGRTLELAKNSLVSAAKIDLARTEAVIARNEIESLKAKLSRIDLMLRSVESKGFFNENGDANYWEKNVDALRIRRFDNEHKILTMQTQVIQAEAQAKEERKRISLNFVEEHRAPVGGVINALFTSVGKRVGTGAPLFQILDCASPIAIVAIPDNRFGEFRVGQKATIMPIDSDESFAGSIQHVSSGPLIGRDTTIAIQPELTINGNKVIVGLDEKVILDGSGTSCNSTRRAIVTLHTPSLFNRLAQHARTTYASLDIATVIETTVASFESAFTLQSAASQLP
jgi:multidrug resistance efflux pump